MTYHLTSVSRAPIKKKKKKEQKQTKKNPTTTESNVW